MNEHVKSLWWLLSEIYKVAAFKGGLYRGVVPDLVPYAGNLCRDLLRSEDTLHCLSNVYPPFIAFGLQAAKFVSDRFMDGGRR